MHGVGPASGEDGVEAHHRAGGCASRASPYEYAVYGRKEGGEQRRVNVGVDRQERNVVASARLFVGEVDHKGLRAPILKPKKQWNIFMCPSV